MHKRCREIMDELILNGELEEITWFKFAPKQELKLRLKDMLEDEVDEKYLLNQELVSKYLETGTASNYKGSQAGKVADENDVFHTVNAGSHGYSMGYVKLKQTHTLNIKGNDSINISVPSSKTRRGRVGKQVAQTLDTACNQVVFNNQYIFRKLTERECFRLQGFNDNFIFPKETKSLYFQFIYDKINEKEIKWNVQSKVVKEKQKQLNTETYVFYTTKEWQDMEQLVKTKIETMQDLKEKMQDVNIVMKKSEEVVQKECATNTIKWTDCIKTLFLEITEKGYQEVEVILEEDTENQSIGQSWRIQLEENLTKEKLYITLILLKQIIISKTYMYVKVHQNTQKFMFSLKSLSRECLKMELSYLKMEYTKELISSSQLYKQAGNGMSRNILDMIFTQIFTCYSKHIEKNNAKNI